VAGPFDEPRARSGKRVLVVGAGRRGLSPPTSQGVGGGCQGRDFSGRGQVAIAVSRSPSLPLPQAFVLTLPVA
jgi:hypothetical protein